jgi:hypothetical protein
VEKFMKQKGSFSKNNLKVERERVMVVVVVIVMNIFC